MVYWSTVCNLFFFCLSWFVTCVCIAICWCCCLSVWLVRLLHHINPILIALLSCALSDDCRLQPRSKRFSSWRSSCWKPLALVITKPTRKLRRQMKSETREIHCCLWIHFALGKYATHTWPPSNRKLWATSWKGWNSTSFSSTIVSYKTYPFKYFDLLTSLFSFWFC